MDHDYQWYRDAFLYSLPVLILGLFIPSLQFLYALCFFAVSVLMVFELGRPEEDPEHSAQTHFDRASRWNTASYLKCAYLVLAALIYSGLSQYGTWILAIIWIIGLVYVRTIEKYLDPVLIENLTTEYISQQLPALNKGDLHAVIDSWERGQDISDNHTPQAQHFDSDTLAKIRHFYMVYKKLK